MALNDLNKNAIAFKKLVGKGHTNQNFAYNEESVTSNVQMSYSTVFGAKINPTPQTSGLTSYYDTDGVVEYLKFPISIIPDTQIGTNQSQGYEIKLPSGYTASGVLGSIYSGGTALSSALGRLQIVPSLYGKDAGDGSTQYDPVLMTASNVIISKFDPIDWIIDPYSGTLFVQSPPAGFDISPNKPAFVAAYLFVGQYLDDALNSGITATVNVDNRTIAQSGGTQNLYVKLGSIDQSRMKIASGATTNGLPLQSDGAGGFKFGAIITSLTGITTSSGLTKTGPIQNPILTVDIDTTMKFTANKLGVNKIGIQNITTGSTSSGLNANKVPIFSGSTYGDQPSVGLAIESFNNRITSLENTSFNGVTGGTNLGTGQGIYAGYSGNTLQFKSLRGKGGLTVTANTTTITVVLTGSTGGGTITGATNGLRITGAGRKIGLGGNITGSTIVNGNSNSLGFAGLSDFSVYGGTNIVLGSAGNQAGYIEAIAVNGVDIGTQGDGASFNLFAGNGDNVGITLNNDNNQFFIVDNRVTPTGIEYFSDYSANYTDRSLVDKAWVLNAVATGSTDMTTANNGLTKSGDNIYLGGSLTGNTSIYGLGIHSLTLGDLSGAGPLSYFNFNALSGASLNTISGVLALNSNNGINIANTSGNVAITTSSGFISSIANGGNINIASIGNHVGVTGNTMTLKSYTTMTLSGATGFGGAKYAGNYSSNFTNRSLVDKQYVTGLTSTIALANNGLTKRTGNNIGLGGALTGNTNITGAFTLNMGTLSSRLTGLQVNAGSAPTNVAVDISSNNFSVVTSGASSNQSFIMGGGNPATLANSSDSNTNATTVGLTIARRVTTGGASNNFGTALRFLLETSTNGTERSANIEYKFTNATQNSAKGRYDFTVNDGTASTPDKAPIVFSIIPSGATFSSNFSAAYTARSVPDVGFVTGQTGGLAPNQKKVQLITAASYTATTTTHALSCSGTTDVYLPANPLLGQEIIISDIVGNAFSNIINIDGNGKTIVGDPTTEIDSDYGSITLLYNGYSWSITAYSV